MERAPLPMPLGAAMPPDAFAPPSPDAEPLAFEPPFNAPVNPPEPLPPAFEPPPSAPVKPPEPLPPAWPCADDVEGAAGAAGGATRPSNEPSALPLPVRPDTCYFSLEAKGQMYERMLQAQSISIYIQSGM